MHLIILGVDTEQNPNDRDFYKYTKNKNITNVTVFFTHKVSPG